MPDNSPENKIFTPQRLFFASLVVIALSVFLFFFQNNKETPTDSPSKPLTQSQTQESIQTLYVQSVLISQSNLKMETHRKKSKNKKSETQKIELPKHTLTNQEIENKIFEKREELQSCQTILLKADYPSEGSVVLNIELSGKGKVVRIKQVETQIEHVQFLNCVQSVIKSVRYRKFDGPNIKAQLPLNFN